MTDNLDFDCIKDHASNKHKKVINETVQYGTAGFRTKADKLDHILYRMGLLAVLRSQYKKAAIGLMITASHNPEADNGVKMVDPAGEMLEASWESIATLLANVEDSEVVNTLKIIIEKHDINTSYKGTVIVGRDTRKSSLKLSEAACTGIYDMNGKIEDFGLVTTPQLHYFVLCINTNNEYGRSSLEGYYEKFCGAYKQEIQSILKVKDNYVNKLYLDAANGVGGFAVTKMLQFLKQALEVEVFNNGEGELNYMCGADFVKIQQKPPINVPIMPFTRCVSIDGDADRIVYYYTDAEKKFHLLDGDKMATLIVSYFKELLEKAQIKLELGIVQTAYANGASTDYISNVLKVPVACVPTGVKHLHHKAQNYDIGVYFEANGHGTVLFKDTAVTKIKKASNESSKDEKKAVQSLVNVYNMINQANGDALTDMLLIEYILYAKDWDIIKWEKSYTDLPNKQVKVQVKDRNIIKTADAERKCILPDGLQQRIDSIVAKYSKGRSFVRPSGTEDIVRVYAECDNQIDVPRLASEVAIAVYELAGGIGEKPEIL